MGGAAGTKLLEIKADQMQVEPRAYLYIEFYLIILVFERNDSFQQFVDLLWLAKVPFDIFEFEFLTLCLCRNKQRRN